MESLGLLAILGIILGMVLLFVSSVRSVRRQAQRKRDLALAMGFVALEAEPELETKLTRLYRQTLSEGEFRLENVFRRDLPNGSLYLFDMLDTSGNETTQVEEQTVAIVSERLDLPTFFLYPQADTTGGITDLANRVLRWVVSRVGTPIDFADAPDFQRRYLVSSPEPDRTHWFLSGERVKRLTQTYLCIIHAGGDLFTFSQFSPKPSADRSTVLGERIELAMEIYQVLLPR